MWHFQPDVLQRSSTAIETTMKLQLLFIAIVLLISPIIWNIPKFWRDKIIMLITFLVFAYIAPLSVFLMTSVAVLQWLFWKNHYFAQRKIGLILTICLLLLP